MLFGHTPTRTEAFVLEVWFCKIVAASGFAHISNEFERFRDIDGVCHFLRRCCPNWNCAYFICFQSIFCIDVESSEMLCAKPMFPLQPGRIFHNSINISLEIGVFLENCAVAAAAA